MDINARIRMVIDSHRLTAGAFADKIGVQRSNVSHVLSGRNKPSFEFLEKVLLAFPKVSALWLITGKQERVGAADPVAPVESGSNVKAHDSANSKLAPIENKALNRKLIKTILFYSDSTCEEYYVNQQ